MKSILLPTICLFAAATFSSQSQEKSYEKDLENLKTQHHAAIEAAMEPLRKRYAYDLETLLKRATLDRDLDTALKIRRELETIQGREESAFVGEWEYQENGINYRRIILKNGSVELWKNGKEWMRTSTTPIWDGHRWKLDGNTLILLDGNGKTQWIWMLNGRDKVAQKDADSGKTNWLLRASDSWK